MDPRNEQQSLASDPLPEIKIDAPLTLVWTIDGEIAALQEQISALQEQRKKALDYAIREQIAEDENYRLDRKAGRIIRALNPEKFREVFPKEWEMIKQIEVRDLNEKLAHAGEKILLGMADKLVKPVVLNAAPGVVTITQATDTYTVVKK